MNDENTSPPQNQPSPRSEGAAPAEGWVASSERSELIKKLEQMTELAKRTMADMQNYKRRQEEERHLIFTMANIEFVIKFLPILDNLERAAAHKPDIEILPENLKEWTKGLDISLTQIQKFLEEIGVKKIEAVGQKFDPNLHEALVHGPGEKDLIVEELEKGYILGDKVIRHAKVKVGNGEK